ncbi:hypothetical protein [Vibrio owensii]|uniref:hypothetical protein n=1 Tax=Vibrio harveyi group TaxID=717610 RepID=UPI003CC69A27
MHSQETMIHWAKGYEGALGDESQSDAYFSPEKAHWTYFQHFDEVELLAHNIGLNSPQEAREWLESEIKMFEEEGHEHRAKDYRSMLDGPIEEEIIVGDGKVNGKHLWDGCHRIAGAYAQGITVPAIVGTLK